MPTNKNIDLVRAGVYLPVLNWLKHNGVDDEKYLDHASIPAEVILTNAWMSKSQGYKFLFNIAEREQCRNLGFFSCADFQESFLGPIYDAMDAATTLKEKLEIFCKQSKQTYQGADYWIQQDRNYAWFCYRQLINPHGAEHVIQATLMIYLSLIRSIVGVHWRPKQIRFQLSIEIDISRV